MNIFNWDFGRNLFKTFFPNSNMNILLLALICCSLPKFCNSKLSMFYKAIISSPLKLRGKFLMPRFFSNLPNCKDAFLDNSDPSRSNSNVHQDRWTQHTSIKSPLQLRSCILDIQLQRSWRKGVFPKIPSVLLYKTSTSHTLKTL